MTENKKERYHSFLGDDFNIDRNRCYGLRVGDIVEHRFSKWSYEGEVVDYGAGDNNRVIVKNNETGEERGEVAEYCTILTKVEDRIS